MNGADEEVDPGIKQEHELDSTPSDVSSGPVIRKVRTLPTCFLSPDFKSGAKSTPATTSRVCKTVKAEPYTIDVDESKISSTSVSQNGETEYKPAIQIQQESHKMPDEREAGSFMEHSLSEVKPEADNIIGDSSSEVSSAHQVPDEKKFMTNGGSEIDGGMDPEIVSSVADSPSTSRDCNDEHDSTLTTDAKKRPACRYGSSCYRVNAQHKADFSHPGDADYGCDSTSDQKVKVNKPDCRYGSQCYRKNEEHRQKFNHPATSSSGRPKRTRTLRLDLHFETGDSDSLEDFSDSDEYESSFVDDNEDSFSDLDEDTDDEERDFSGGSDTSEDEDGKKRKKENKRDGCKKKKFSLF